jgi:hypothetical protein
MADATGQLVGRVGIEIVELVIAELIELAVAFAPLTVLTA